MTNETAQSLKQQLAMRHEITRILLGQKSLDETIFDVIQIVCHTMQFAEGEFWRSSQNDQQLHCACVWSTQDADAKLFAVHAAKVTFSPGKGLPGLAYLKKKAYWIDDIVHHPDFLRAKLAQDAKLTSAFALPIFLEEKVLGILIFFSPIRYDFNNYIIEMFLDIAQQIGIFLDRYQARKRAEELSHQAGMAEVAASMLHNIGNVLNSANISLALLHKNIVLNEDFKQLLAVIALLKEHREELPHFLIEDEKGKLLPQYLIAVADYLDESNKVAASEVYNLSKQIKHIEEVVATQQFICNVSKPMEKIFLINLVDAALQMCRPDLTNRNIEIQVEYNAQPFVFTDSSKVVQILVNLIQNAKDALTRQDYPVHQKKIHIQINQRTSDNADIEIRDNGIGILPENLSKIFSMGFTTKSSGRGFGLHTSALSAEDIGGILHAESEGLGKGAVFILTLPLYAENQS